MTILILGLILFLGMHSVQIVMPDIRARVIARGGGRGRGCGAILPSRAQVLC